MKSKRIWVAKDFDVGYKSKSHMAEFSPNPDGRNKRDTSFKEYKKRLNIEEDIRMKNRISINRLRNNQNLAPFLEQSKYEEIGEESELEGQDLVDFLIQYNLDLELDDNLKKFIPSKKNQNIKYKILEKNGILYIKLGSLAYLLKTDNQKLLEIMKVFNDDLINDKNVRYYPEKDNIYREIKNKKSTYFISYSLILAFSLNYKISQPKGKLNQSFFLLISDFERNMKRLRLFSSFIMFTSLGMFSLNLVEQYFKLFEKK